MKNQSQKLRRDTKFAYLISAPMFIYIGIVLMIPVVWGIYMSFTNKVIGGKETFIGLQNYIALLKNAQFRKAVCNTVVYTFFSILGKLVFGLIMALVLNSAFRGRNLARALMIIPWTLPNIVAVLNWRWIFSDIGGVANYILRTLGIINHDLVWLGDASLAMFAILLANIWRGTPFFGISILARLQTIPKDYYEAACIDGANIWQKFIYITLPSILDVTLLTMLVSTIWTINEFESVWLLTGGGPSGATEVIGVFSYRTAMTNMQLGLGVSVSVLAMPVLLLLISLVSRQMLKEDK
ncbi:MAG: sugar ABC transporter permease [Oscillospiraceae bacterium]